VTSSIAHCTVDAGLRVRTPTLRASLSLLSCCARVIPVSSPQVRGLSDDALAPPPGHLSLSFSLSLSPSLSLSRTATVLDQGTAPFWRSLLADMPNETDSATVRARKAVRAVVRQLRGLVVQPVQGRHTEHHDDSVLIEYLAAIALKLWAAPFHSFLTRAAGSRQLKDTRMDFELELQLLYWQFNELQSTAVTLRVKLQTLARLLVCRHLSVFVADASPAVDLIQICHSMKELSESLLPDLLVSLSLYSVRINADVLFPQEWKGAALDRSTPAAQPGIAFAEELEIAVDLADVSIPRAAVPARIGRDKWRENLHRLAFTSMLGSAQESRAPASEATNCAVLNQARRGLGEEMRVWYQKWRSNLTPELYNSLRDHQKWAWNQWISNLWKVANSIHSRLADPNDPRLRICAAADFLVSVLPLSPHTEHLKLAQQSLHSVPTPL
jgi:hypothetical protein